MKLRHLVILILFLFALALTVFSAPMKVNVDSKTRAIAADDGTLVFDWKGTTLTLGSVTVSDAAGIRTFDYGSTNGTKLGATGNKIGFLGATPMVRPSSTTDLRQALINLGLYTTGGSSPLNLNGGAFTSGTLSSTTGTFSSTLAVTGNATLGGTLGVTGAISGTSLTLSGNETITGTLGVTGASTLHAISGTNETLSGTLDVSGISTLATLNGADGDFSGTLNVDGDTTMGGLLGVTGDVTLDNRLIVGASATIGTQLGIGTNLTVGGTETVTGASTLNSLTVTNGSTLHAVTGTTGSFSGTFNATGNSTFGGTLGITGATSGAAFSFTGNGTITGTLGVTGASTFTTTSATNGLFSGTLGVTGNSTFGGTVGVTGILSGTRADFSGNTTVGGTFAATGNSTVGGTLNSTGTLSSSAQVANLDYIDVSKAPYSADMTGVANSATALNSAITAAGAAGKGVYIPEGTLSIASTINVTVPVHIKATRRADYDFSASGGTTIKWIGADGGTMMHYTNVERVGAGVSNILFDCNGLAAFGLIVDGVTGGRFDNNSFAEFTTGAGLEITANGSTHTCSYNVFTNTIIVSHETASIAGLWVSGALGDTSNSAHNTFINTFIIHVGSTPAIRLGYTDNTGFYDTYIFRSAAGGESGAGVLVDPSEHLNFPSANVFVHLTAGDGGWVQPGTTSLVAVPARIYGYQRDNGAPAPVTNGTYLFWEDNSGNLAVNTLTVGNLPGSIKTTAIFARVYNDADISISSGVETALTFNSEISDNDSMHSTSSLTGRLTCVSAGTYTVVGNVSFDINATGYRFMSLRYNGSTVIGSTTIPAVPANYTTICVSSIVTLAAGDYVDFTVGHNAGSPLLVKSFYAQSPQFMMVRNP